jgi:hypothetical protein
VQPSSSTLGCIRSGRPTVPNDERHRDGSAKFSGAISQCPQGIAHWTVNPLSARVMRARTSTMVIPREATNCLPWRRKGLHRFSQKHGDAPLSCEPEGEDLHGYAFSLDFSIKFFQAARTVDETADTNPYDARRAAVAFEIFRDDGDREQGWDGTSRPDRGDARR